MRPYAEGKRWILYRCDALSLLPTLPDASVDGLVTDAPYSSGGQFRGDRMGSVQTKYLSTGSKQAEYLPAFAGDTRDQRSFLLWCTLWLGECLRIVRPGRAAVLFTDWRQLPTTTDALQSGGWVWRGIVPWVKPNPRPNIGCFPAAAEYAVWGTSGPSANDPEIGYLKGWHLEEPPRGDDREHVTQKPLGVMRTLLRIVPEGGTVLDPFAGSGSTGAAALETGRRFIGCEWTEANAEVAARRLAQAEHDGVPVPLFATGAA